MFNSFFFLFIPICSNVYPYLWLSGSRWIILCVCAFKSNERKRYIEYNERVKSSLCAHAHALAYTADKNLVGVRIARMRLSPCLLICAALYFILLSPILAWRSGVRLDLLDNRPLRATLMRQPHFFLLFSM